MRFYNNQHNYYCGIDLHARLLYVCILDSLGNKVLHKKIDADPDALIELITPYQDNIVIGVECMHCWYWVSDLCLDYAFDFVLGHALYIKAIHGGKMKNDRIDSYKIASLLRGGNFPIAYVYPKAMRATRDLLRRRTKIMRHGADLKPSLPTPLANTISKATTFSCATHVPVNRSVVSGSPSPLALINRFIGAHSNNEQQSCLHLG